MQGYSKGFSTDELGWGTRDVYDKGFLVTRFNLA